MGSTLEVRTVKGLCLGTILTEAPELGNHNKPGKPGHKG